MSQKQLENLIDDIGLKATIALLAQICSVTADETEERIGDLEGKAKDWRADGRTLRSILPRLRN